MFRVKAAISLVGLALAATSLHPSDGLAETAPQPDLEPAKIALAAPVVQNATPAKTLDKGSVSEKISNLPGATLPLLMLPVRKPQAAAPQTQTAAATAGSTLQSPAKPKKIPKTLRVHVNLTTQTMSINVKGVEQHIWKVSTGRGRYRTPNGTFRPQWTKRMHYSRQWNNSPMPYSVFFHRGYAVHGTEYVRSLGRPASHGCVRLATANAKTFYDLVKRHGMAATQIRVTGKTPYVPTRRVASYVKRKAAAKRKRYRRRKKVFWPFDL